MSINMSEARSIQHDLMNDFESFYFALEVLEQKLNQGNMEEVKVLIEAMKNKRELTYKNLERLKNFLSK